MDSQRPSVSLKKPEPWTDPVTGEIYPGGRPGAIPQPTVRQPLTVETYANTVLQPVQSGGTVPSGNVKHCTHCGAEIANGAKFCSSCGTNTGLAAGDNMKHCTHCGSRLPNNAMFCSSCGMEADRAVSGEVKYCSYCGGQIPFEARFCSKCGRETGSSAANVQQPIIINNNIVQNAQPVVVQHGKQKSKWLAFILCFFFGTFGVHRFYEGKVGTGILWLFTFGMFGIGWLVDLIIILTKSDPYYV